MTNTIKYNTGNERSNKNSLKIDCDGCALFRLQSPIHRHTVDSLNEVHEPQFGNSWTRNQKTATMAICFWKQYCDIILKKKWKSSLSQIFCLSLSNIFFDHNHIIFSSVRPPSNIYFPPSLTDFVFRYQLGEDSIRLLLMQTSQLWMNWLNG